MTTPVDAFEALRPRLFGVAYGILGTVADAEDVVQETWIAWDAADHGSVASAAAYLTRTVSNRALNRLRDMRRRREEYRGPWLPEPMDTARRPDEAAELADSVSFAMLVLLERLSPLERAAFVLREVFDVPTAEVAEMLQTSPAAVRQLASRAGAHLRAESPRYEVDRDRHLAVSNAFVTAIAEGDVRAAMDILAPDVELVTDGGGKVAAAGVPLHGPERVAHFYLGLAAKYPDFRIRPAEFNGMPAIVVHADDTASIVQIAVRDGLIARVWVTRNPDKLTDLR